MPSVTLDDRTVTLAPEEAAERLRLRASTLRNMRWRGDGPPFLRLGGRVRYRLVDLAAWLDDRVHTSSAG